MVTVSRTIHDDAPSRGRLTVVYLIHEAFRRDLARLSGALRSAGSDPARVRALRDHWNFVRDQLRHHHYVEDMTLWPIIRPKLVRQPEDLAVLDEMKAEHLSIEPNVRSVDLAFSRLAEATTTKMATLVASGIDDLAIVLESHLDAEETRCLPVIDWALSYDEFEAFGKATAKAIGWRGSSGLFPWIFDGADPVERRVVLTMPPRPVRLLCRYVWEPRYRRYADRLWGV